MSNSTGRFFKKRNGRAETKTGEVLMKLAAALARRVRLIVLTALTAALLPCAGADAAVVFNNWSSNGPAPIPNKGTLTALAVAPTTPATIYVGADGGGVYGMSDGGSIWSALNGGLSNRRVAALAVHPVDPKVIFVATAQGIFKSADGGLSWNDSSTGASGVPVRAIAIDPLSTATVYAATGSGVYKSTTGGSSWSTANTGLLSLDVRALLVDPSTPGVLYAATAGGVYKSADGAATWNAANTSLADTDVLSLAYAATTPVTLFVGTATGMYLSTDGAATWAQDGAASLGSQAVASILVDNPSAPTVLYAGTANGIYRQSYTSGNWGNWSAFASGLTPGAAVHALANIPTSRTTLYAATTLGAFKSTGAAWSSLSSGLRQGRAVTVKPTDPTVVVAGFAGGGIYRSTDSGSSWSATIDNAAGGMFATALLYDATGTALYAASGNGVFRSTNDGGGWTDISATLPTSDVRALALDAGATLHAATSLGVFVWNGVDTWSAYGAGQPSNSDVTTLTFKGGYLFAGTNGGGVFRSDGTSWTQVNSGLTNTVVYTVASDGVSLYLGTGAGLFKSGDNGTTWVASSSGLTNIVVKSIALSGGVPNFITAGTAGGGVFFSTNGGDIWTAMNTGLTDKNVNALSANAATKKVYAATATGRVFNLNLSAVSAVTPAAPLASAPYSFGQVNIGDTKQVSFSLQNTGTLQLKISSLSLAGTDAALYGITQGGARECNLALLPNLTVEAGDYCTVTVGFLPVAPGNKTASLTVHSDAVNQPVTTFLIGTGGYPPQATITSPVSGDTRKSPVLIAGSAIDRNQSDGSAGTGATLAKVEVSTDGGTTWQSATKSPTLNSWTQWSYSWTASPLPPNGPYVIKARATDTNGFVQSALSSINLTLDNTPPVTTITSFPPLLDSTASGSFGFTVDKAGSTSVCRIDSGISNACSSPFSFAALPDGSHTFSVLSTDTVGNVETTAKTYTWTIDTTPPATTITTVPAAYTQLTSASFTFSANETSTFACSLDGVTTSCTSPKSYTGLADGPHLFTVQGTDLAGNTSTGAPTTRSYGWIVDANNKPTSSVNVPLAPLSGISYQITGSAADTVSGVSGVNISVNGGGANAATDTSVAPAAPWSSWGYLWSLPVNGTYTVQAQAVDNAGNVQAATTGSSFIVNNPLPEVALGGPTDGALLGSGSPHLITGTAQAATGGLPLQKVQVAIFPSATPPATVSWQDAAGSTAWSYNWQFPADGNYTIQARALDVAPNLSGAVTGNPSQVVSRSVTIDTTPPTSTITPLVTPYLTGQQITVSGTADDPAPGTGVKQITIAIVNALGQSVTGTPFYNSGNKSWSYTSGALPDGSYTVQATVTDNAGNQQSPPASVNVVIDNVAPVTTITAKPSLLSNLSSATFSFSANEPATFICSLDGVSAPCNCSASTTTSCTVSYSALSTAQHTFAVSAKDVAGNVETPAKAYSWTVDLVPPVVSSTTPADGAVRLSVATHTVSVVFSKDVDPATVNGNTFYLTPAVPGAISYDQATHTATLTLSAPLAYATTYTATLTGAITDPAGNRLLQNYTWSFATDPDGDMNLDGKVDLADAQLCLKAAVGKITPTAQQLRHADLAPFRNGKPLPDGRLDASDALIILARMVGAVTW